jgi:hypothetical protein
MVKQHARAVTLSVRYSSSHWQLAWAQLQSANYQAPKAKPRKTKRCRTDYRFFDDAVWFK